ncbi:hypothetical protein BDQ17DRAFT_1342336 [Cyathus striatus]|nr:hypothetical protein BDQ17DRAFT_1342336 [Cyathus striatus]
MATVEELVNQDIGSLLASRYLPAASFTWWVWRGRGKSSWILKSAYTFNLYGTEVCLLFIIYVTSVRIPLVESRSCRDYWILTLIFGTTAAEVFQFILLLRVYSLTGYRGAIIHCLTTGIIVAASLSQVFVILTILGLKNEIILSGANTCIPTVQNLPYISGIFAPMWALDIFVIMFTTYSALKPSHRINAELVPNLYKKGAKFFLPHSDIYVLAIHLAEFVIFTFHSVSAVCWIFNVIFLSEIHFMIQWFEVNVITFRSCDILS